MQRKNKDENVVYTLGCIDTVSTETDREFKVSFLFVCIWFSTDIFDIEFRLDIRLI